MISSRSSTSERTRLREAVELENPEIHPESVRRQFCESTGLPELFLDDAVALSKPEIKSSLEQEILGQTEALEAVVDILAKFKAGLNDPRRPLGVFLFTGPTGVGQTAIVCALGSRAAVEVSGRESGD